MNERWLPLENYGWLEVSDRGRVRALSRVVEYVNARGTLVRKPLSGGPRKLSRMSNGYLFITVEGFSLSIHRLVAKAFVPGFVDGLDVNHKNGLRADNVWTNLEWMTRSQNIQHSYDVLGRKPHGLTQAVSVDDTIYPSMLAASKALGVSAGSVASAVRRNHLCQGKTICVVPRTS